MIDWKKYFDAVYILHYAGYKHIEDKMHSELKRVGLSDSGILHIHENISSPFFDILKQNINCEKRLTSSSVFSCAFGHYSIMKIAELNNYNKILIMEDDFSFLKNLDKISEILEEAEKTIKDYDLCLFSHFQTPCPDIKTEISNYLIEMKTARKNNQLFIPFSKTTTVSSGLCYALSKNGYIALRGLYEYQMELADIIYREIPFQKDEKIDNFKYQVLNNLKRFYSRVPICIQKCSEQSMTKNNLRNNFQKIMQYQQQIAEAVGIKYDDYID